MFNLRVPLEARDEVFLMNTLTDAQLIVSSDVAALLDRVEKREVSGSTLDAEAREALDPVVLGYPFCADGHARVVRTRPFPKLSG